MVAPAFKNPFIPANIPQELKNLDRWVSWTGELNPAQKLVKTLLIPGGFQRASNQKPSNWASFDTAVTDFRTRISPYAGVAIALPYDLIAVIDIDNAFTPDGQLKPEAAAIVEMFKGYYMEKSPNGGLHIVTRYVAGIQNRKGRYEIYCRNRFMTFTGDVLDGSSLEIKACDEKLLEFFKTHFPPSNPAKPKHIDEMDFSIELDGFDDVIIQTIRADFNISSLWDGDWKSYDRYPSQSEADLALCNHIAFRTGPNPHRIWRVFANSGLMRSKWMRPDYAANTIALALPAGRTFHPEACSAETTGASRVFERLAGPGRQFQSHVSPELLSFGAFADRYPQQRDELILGVLRMGEIMNLVASPKSGKSWFAHYLALCVAIGRSWFGRGVTAGKVLIVDNELQPATLQRRIAHQAAAMGIEKSVLDQNLSILSLRGMVMPLSQVRRLIENSYGDQQFSLVILDASYRMLEEGMDENDNAAITRYYNSLDAFAHEIGGSIVVVHHMSKGGQENKSLTDIGSGAGSQSRAADAHFALRPHVDDNIYSLTGVLRSFAQLPAFCVEFKHPTWLLREDLDPSRLRQPNDRRNEGIPQRPVSFDTILAAAGVRAGPIPMAQAFTNVVAELKVSNREAERLVRSAILNGWLESGRRDGRGNQHFVWLPASNEPGVGDAPSQS